MRTQKETSRTAITCKAAERERERSTTVEKKKKREFFYFLFFLSRSRHVSAMQPPVVAGGNRWNARHCRSRHRTVWTKSTICRAELWGHDPTHNAVWLCITTEQPYPPNAHISIRILNVSLAVRCLMHVALTRWICRCRSFYFLINCYRFWNNPTTWSFLRRRQNVSHDVISNAPKCHAAANTNVVRGNIHNCFIQIVDKLQNRLINYASG